MSSVAAIASPAREICVDSPSPIRREVGSIALMLTGLGSIIGSGWLFGAWRRAWRHVSGVRWHGSFRPLFARVAGRIHRCVGELDLDRFGRSGGSRSVSAIHGLLALAMGAPLIRSSA